MIPPTITATAVPVPAKVPRPLVEYVVYVYDGSFNEWRAFERHAELRFASRTAETLVNGGAHVRLAHVTDTPRPDARDARIRALREAMKIALDWVVEDGTAYTRLVDALAADDAAARKETA